MALETYKKEQARLEKEEQKEKGIEVEEEKEELTLPEIMADKSKNTLLGTMVEKSGTDEEKELMKRMLAEKLEEGDLKKLNSIRHKFNETMDRVEAIKEEMTPEFIKEVSGYSKEFKEIVESLGADVTDGMIKERMADLSVTDTDRFGKIAKKIEAMQAFKKGEYKALDDKITKIAKDHKINSDEYLKALALKDPVKMEEALSDMVRKSWGDGGWGKTKKVIDSFASMMGFGSKSTARKLASEKFNVEDVFAELDKHKKNIGKALSATISGNEDMRAAFSKAIMGESLKLERGVGMKESKDVMVKPDEVKSKWNANKGTINIGGRKWDQLNDVEKDNERQKFADKLKKESAQKAKGKGFWASLFEAIFGSFIDNEVKNLN